jgi:hypothetical protein
MVRRDKVSFVSYFLATLENINIFIYDANGQLLKTEFVKAEKGKFAFQPNQAGLYQFCATIFNEEAKNVLMGLKIHSDNMDEPKLDKAIKVHDVSAVQDKVNEIITGGRGYIYHQETELEEENHNSKIQMAASRNYYILTVVQSVIILGLGLYQVFSFRKFLSSNLVI